jgi:DNA-binding response OmpR family regulator
MNMVKILIVDDEPDILEFLRYNLEKEQFVVFSAGDGITGFQIAKNEIPDLIILDIMMPKMDGFALAKEIRELDKRIPILFLTAKAMKDDKLQGFEAGADDYLTKPFAMEELLARITAIMRRVELKTGQDSEFFMLGAIKYEPSLRILHLSEGEKKLTTKENQLLELLVKNENDILDRQATLRAVWGDDNYFNGRSMDVYIAKLRKLLREEERIEIMNVHGKGFKFLVK